MTSVIILYNISGTDPEKETNLKVFLVQPDKVQKKIKIILKNIYTDFIEENDNDDDLNIFYQNTLNKIKNTKEIDTEKLPYDNIYKKTIKMCKKFNEPSGSLVALDYHTSYNMHYYIEIQEDITDEIDIIVHEH